MRVIAKNPIFTGRRSNLSQIASIKNTCKDKYLLNFSCKLIWIYNNERTKTMEIYI